MHRLCGCSTGSPPCHATTALCCRLCQAAQMLEHAGANDSYTKVALCWCQSDSLKMGACRWCVWRCRRRHLRLGVGVSVGGGEGREDDESAAGFACVWRVGTAAVAAPLLSLYRPALCVSLPGHTAYLHDDNNRNDHIAVAHIATNSSCGFDLSIYLPPCQLSLFPPPISNPSIVCSTPIPTIWRKTLLWAFSRPFISFVHRSDRLATR